MTVLRLLPSCEPGLRAPAFGGADPCPKVFDNCGGVAALRWNHFGGKREITNFARCLVRPTGTSHWSASTGQALEGFTTKPRVVKQGETLDSGPWYSISAVLRNAILPITERKGIGALPLYLPVKQKGSGRIDARQRK